LNKCTELCLHIYKKKTNLQYCKYESTIVDCRQLSIIEFISKDEWPPNTLDSKPDKPPSTHRVLSLTFKYQKHQPRPTNISELKVALQSIWNALPQDPIDRSILSFTKRLRACIKANGGHFEYRV